MEFRAPAALQPLGKFADPNWTAKGERRAEVGLDQLETLWINTGTLCNIECVNCYIESSPSNDRLEYITAGEVTELLDEIKTLKLNTREIAFTGGEPFMNPHFLDMLEDSLQREFSVLVLTNAMQPMQRPRIKKGLLKLRDTFGDRLTLRVSLDHYSKILHESERGEKTWARAISGLDWLSEHGFSLAIAGRTCWNEDEASSRQGFAQLIAEHRWSIDPDNPTQLMLLPEMDGKHDVPEITTECWSILGKQPRDMMCASSRMIVKRKGTDKPTVVPCTLLPYEPDFEMGSTLAASLTADTGMFAKGAVKLCHAHCAKFCVLGGGSCS
ncbi:MAG: radical SAM protein [Hyphomicrobiales bacterium]|nr:radical SAM protein [Hyphomicrobiales bacterium]